MDNKVKQELERIEIPEELRERVLLGIERAERETKPKKRWSFRKKLLMYSGVAVLMLGVFVGSAFVSPTMARVMASIPYLSLIFESEPISSIIHEELVSKGYDVSSTGAIYKPEKVIEVRLEGSDAQFNEVKDDVEKIIKQVLKSKKYDGYSVEVKKELVRDEYVLNEQQLQEQTILNTEVTKRLEQLEYPFDNVQTDSIGKEIYINIVGSKSYYEDVRDDVEKLTREVANANQYMDYKINVTRVTTEVGKPDIGALITSAIAEGLMSKKEYKVSGVAYKSKPLTFIISTSIEEDEPAVEQLAEKIEITIVDFLASDKIVSILNNEPYEIIVYSKDKKKIN